MKRNVVVSIVLLSMILASVGGAESEPAQRPEERQTYESPVLSLILLPVNLLIKMASLLGSEPPAKQGAPSSTPPADGAK